MLLSYLKEVYCVHLMKIEQESCKEKSSSFLFIQPSRKMTFPCEIFGCLLFYLNTVFVSLCFTHTYTQKKIEKKLNSEKGLEFLGTSAFSDLVTSYSGLLPHSALKSFDKYAELFQKCARDVHVRYTGNV